MVWWHEVGVMLGAYRGNPLGINLFEWQIKLVTSQGLTCKLPTLLSVHLMSLGWTTWGRSPQTKNPKLKKKILTSEIRGKSSAVLDLRSIACCKNAEVPLHFFVCMTPPRRDRGGFVSFYVTKGFSLWKSWRYFADRAVFELPFSRNSYKISDVLSIYLVY